MISQTLTITQTKDNNLVTLFLKGTINTETASKLGEALMALDYSDLNLLIDMADTDYITSAGLRTLLVARKKLSDDTMRIIHANESITEVFKTTGFDSFIKLDPKEISDESCRLSLAALLAHRVAADQAATAYIHKDVCYSWEDVDKASQIIADDLARMGVRKGTHVGICGPNSINWIFTCFAIQKLGAIAVLVNPALRPNEVLGIAEISEITHLCYAAIPKVTTFEQYKNACLGGPFIKYAYDISDTVDFSARFGEYENIRHLYREKHHADDACVIIFSSGSTGKPKAILSSAFNVNSNLEPITREFHFGKRDINLAFLPMFHIFGFSMAICGSLLTGYVSVIPENKAPATQIALIDKYKCTIFNTVPTMMLAIIMSPDFTPEKLASLRVSVLGGSATTEEQLKMLRRLMPGTHFGNVYGMSENAAISLTGYEDTVEHITTTVGKPLSHIELEIRDVSTGAALPVGETGEICIRSNTMVVCYYKLDIMKQPVDDEGWLATGDLGILDEEGYLRIVGRIKDLIICGGENISPGEIAEVLASFPEIADVKVIGIPDEIKGEVVAAAVVLKQDAVWDEANVRARAAEKLAKYKLPVHYILFDSFPLLGSGKVDAMKIKEETRRRVRGE